MAHHSEELGLSADYQAAAVHRTVLKAAVSGEREREGRDPSHPRPPPLPSLQPLPPQHSAFLSRRGTSRRRRRRRCVVSRVAGGPLPSIHQSAGARACPRRPRHPPPPARPHPIAPSRASPCAGAVARARRTAARGGPPPASPHGARRGPHGPPAHPGGTRRVTHGGTETGRKQGGTEREAPLHSASPPPPPPPAGVHGGVRAPRW